VRIKNAQNIGAIARRRREQNKLAQYVALRAERQTTPAHIGAPRFDPSVYLPGFIQTTFDSVFAGA
jgi:hypothetical protein